MQLSSHPIPSHLMYVIVLWRYPGLSNLSFWLKLFSRYHFKLASFQAKRAEFQAVQLPQRKELKVNICSEFNGLAWYFIFFFSFFTNEHNNNNKDQTRPDPSLSDRASEQFETSSVQFEAHPLSSFNLIFAINLKDRPTDRLTSPSRLIQVFLWFESKLFVCSESSLLVVVVFVEQFKSPSNRIRPTDGHSLSLSSTDWSRSGGPSDRAANKQGLRPLFNNTRVELSHYYYYIACLVSFILFLVVYLQVKVDRTAGGRAGWSVGRLA